LDPLDKVAIIYRNGMADSVSSTTTLDTARMLFDQTLFTNPTVYFQAVGLAPFNNTASIYLVSSGVADFGLSGLTTISDSQIDFTMNSKTWNRSGPLSVPPGERLLPQIVPTGAFNFIDSAVVIECAK
jgi:hypothetical protein